uniref:Dehydrogenase/reductase SDR family member on chromosome X n=1 Tax=Davidia involucrata TaxID=16924 RepID=A0A5B7BX11_DAVIN
MAVKELGEALHFACTVEFWRMAVFWTLSLIISYLRLFAQSLFTQKSRSSARRSAPPVPPPTTATHITTATRRPVCIITGATSGLGAAAAYAFSMEGFYVVLAGRSSHLLSKVMSDIRKRNKDAHLKAFQVDLSSFQSILKFKSSLQQWLLDSDMHSSVQLLINNAGILATSCRLTAEGYDQMMATNYIGAFSLTKVLIPLLENSPVPSRIVNVTSFTHRNVSDIQVDKETISGKCFSKLKCYPCAHIYEYSKLCLLFFSYELHRQFGQMEKSHQISVIAVDPGFVKTNIMREVPSCLSQVAFFVLKLVGLLQSPENGVCSILDAALAPPETSGVYFFGGNGRTLNSSALSYNTKLSEELWATSCDLFLELQLSSKDTST